jgi:hypothetical protein
MAMAARTTAVVTFAICLIVRLLNETIAGCEGQDIRNWKPEEQ